MQNKPAIMISQKDYQHISRLLDQLPDDDTTDRLAQELDRAQVLEDGELPANVVAMHSTVTFTVLSTASTFTYTLVYPHEAHGKDSLSILTPVGSALLGLSVGQEMEWPLEHGKTTRVRIDTTTGQ